jgi:predicted metal-binding transcription factor (methanogenesis marker protein 9)
MPLSFWKSFRRRLNQLHVKSWKYAESDFGNTKQYRGGCHMDTAKRKRLEKAGWRVGTAQEFLNLSPEEAAYVEVKLNLAKQLSRRRKSLRMTQIAVAKKIKSSQSRVAKMEAGDPSVSIDLLVRSLLALGETPGNLQKAL